MSRPGRRLLAGTLFLASLAFGAGTAGAATLAEVARAGQASAAGLFGSVEVHSESLQALPQWRRVLESASQEAASFERCLEDEIACITPVLKNWRRILIAAGPLSRPAQIQAVNEYFNRWPYKRDQELYGEREYWATPTQFMTRSGDCEDYSIAKYFALRRLGFAPEALRVVILMDRIRGIGHAVLAVYLEDDIVILDSLSNLVLSHERYRHYLPQYSMNEQSRWAHIGGFEEPSRTPYQGLASRK